MKKVCDDTKTSPVGAHTPAAGRLSTARRCLFPSAEAPRQPGAAWDTVLENLRAGSEDGIQNALLFLDARGLPTGPALARLQGPRPSATTASALERRRLDAILSAAIAEAEMLARAGAKKHPHT